MLSLPFFNYLAKLFFRFTKILIYLTKLGAALETAGNHANRGGHSNFLGRHVYIQTPGDHVFIGTFQSSSYIRRPAWIETPHIIENDAGRVFLRMVIDSGFTSNLVPFHNNAHSIHVRGYRFYIQLSNNRLFHAVLQPNNLVRNIPEVMRVFVRIPGQPNIIYSGIVEPLIGYRPVWLPHEN